MNGSNGTFNHTITLHELMNDFRSAVLPVTIFIGVENVLALFGNSFVLYGFTFRYPRCTYRSLVLYLAFVDLFSCFTTIPAEIFTEMFWFEFKFLSICKAKSFVNVFTLSIEILLLLTIAVDRYKQTCVPQTVQMSPDIVAYIFFGCLLAAACLAVPAAVGFGKHNYVFEYNGANVSVVICGIAGEYSHGNFSLIFSVCLQTTACLSLAAMFVIYLIIMNAICSRRKDIEMNSEATPLISRDLENHVNIDRRNVQMFIVSLVFIVTTIACRVIGFIVNFRVQKFTIENTVITTFFFRLYFINHVIHPVIYGFLDPKFRETMKSMCCHRARKDRLDALRQIEIS